jgi:RNA polymerase sigma-70 factor (ECF subfamily)
MDTAMSNSQTNTVLRYIRTLPVTEQACNLTDRELMEHFKDRNEEDAFAGLVCRHGPMVLNLCQRILQNEHDAEDAFQATFLVLSRKATSLPPRESLCGWLHSVAGRIAQKAKVAAARRRKNEGLVPEKPVGDPLAQMSLQEARKILDAELARLPDKFRAPLILCYLEGLARDEAANRLGWSVSTLKSRLKQARDKLGRRLASRGIPLSIAFGSLLFHEGMALGAVPSFLMNSTIEAVMCLAAGNSATSAVSAKVVALTEGVLKAMYLTKLKTVLTVMLALSLIGAAASVFTYRTLGGDQKELAKQVGVKPAEKVADERKSDKTDKDKLQGSWNAVSAEMGGKEIPEETVKSCKFVFTNDKVVIIGLFRGEKEKGVEGTFKLVPTAKPKAIDITITNKEDALGIYDLKEDTLTICMVEATGNQRPNEFAGKDKQILIVLKRTK